ncbi:MAG: hypothetical protein WAL89_02710 [Candidatus Sulfotelmatobacter sp.]|jgi:hypothetical protein
MKLISLGIALAVVVVVFGSNCGLRGQEREGKMKVYYFPIGAQTLTPVTSANIEERGRHCEISSAKDIHAIKSVLDSAKPSSQNFSDRAVRVKLVEASDTGDKLLALVENDGAVRFATGKEGMISSKSMETLKKVIDPQCSK